MISQNNFYTLRKLLGLVLLFVIFISFYVFFIALIVSFNVEGIILVSVLEGISIFLSAVFCYAVLKKNYKLKLLAPSFFSVKETLIFLKGFVINGSIYCAFIFMAFYYTFISFTITDQDSSRVVLGIFWIGIFKFYLVSLSEELIYRKFAIDYLRDSNISTIWIIIITTTCFSLSHGWESWLVFFLLFLSGLILSISYLMFHSISFGLGIHFAWNFLTYIFSLDNNSDYGTEYPQLVITETTHELFGQNIMYSVDILAQFVLLIVMLIVYKTRFQNIFESD